MRLRRLFSALERKLSPAFADVLPPGQQRTLAAWVADTVLAGSRCLTLVTAALVAALGVGAEQTVRHASRAFLYDGAEHSAPCRVQLDPVAAVLASTRAGRGRPPLAGAAHPAPRLGGWSTAPTH